MNGITFFFKWEPALVEWLQARLGTVGATAAEVMTLFGEELVLVAILGTLYWWFDKSLGIRMGETLLTACALNLLVKNCFCRRRPYFDHEKIKCLRAPEPDADPYDIGIQGYSFPSGHSMNAASAYGTLSFRFERGERQGRHLITILCTAVILLVGISRVALGVHYPTDVLVGWGLGGLTIIGLGLLERILKNSAVRYLLLVVLVLPGWFFCRGDDFYSVYGLLIGFFAGVLYEERFVKFENTANPIRGFLRVIFGLALFLGLSGGMKVIIPPVKSDIAAHLLRMVRYMVSCFAVIGLYPMLFSLTGKIGGKKSRGKCRNEEESQ